MAAQVGARQEEIKQLWRSFFMYALGVFLVYSAYGSLLGLQSSINVTDGLGTIATATLFATAVGSSILCIPMLIRKFGAKTCVWGCEITYIIYVMANFYPKFGTMLPAGIIVGIGDSVLWSCMPILNAFFADRYSSISRDKRDRCHKSKFSGYFYSIFQMAKISGNLVSYAVLYGFNSEIDTSTNSTHTAQNNQTDSMALAKGGIGYCGADDCQDPKVVLVAITQYVPTSQLTLYILLGIMCLLCAGAVAIHAKFIPSTGSFGIPGSTNGGGFGENHPQQESEIQQGNGCVSFAVKGIRDVFSQIFAVKQLLLTPAIFYTGMEYGFLTSELSRSYTSCVFGVTWVPVHMMCYGASACVVCYLTGKLSKKVPRIGFIVLAAIVDLGVCIYCLLWTPSAATQLAVIPMYVLMGGMQGVWIPVTQATQVIAFPERLDVGTPVWNFWFMLGIALQFAWSTSLCVSSKIYAQIGLLSLSVVLNVILERRLHKGDIGNMVEVIT